MIEKFDETTALLLVDVQKGVNEVKYYGGPSGKRNNHSAEENMRCLLAEWRRLGKRVAFTRHNSREINSPLKLELETGNQIEGLESVQIFTFKNFKFELKVLKVIKFPKNPENAKN